MVKYRKRSVVKMSLCPKCGSKKVRVSNKSSLGIVLLMMGAFINTIGLFIWPLLILGTPFMIISIPLLLKKGKKFKGGCMNCLHRWEVPVENEKIERAQ
jgi:hypothetical protein